MSKNLAEWPLHQECGAGPQSLRDARQVSREGRLEAEKEMSQRRPSLEPPGQVLTPAEVAAVIHDTHDPREQEWMRQENGKMVVMALASTATSRRLEPYDTKPLRLPRHIPFADRPRHHEPTDPMR
jgi:hypothetical protein